MEIDTDFLEVNVEENEFDNCITDATEHRFEEDQKMDSALAEETSAKLDIRCKGSQEDLRVKIQRNKQKKGEAKDDSKDEVDKVRRETKRRRDSSIRRQRGNERNSRNGRLYKALYASSDLDPKILGRELAYRLGELKVGLIVNVVRVLGFKCAMQILEDTRKIERNGGMLTADGSRRRTPGGVYICCLKDRGYATKKELESIFKDEKERVKEKFKRRKQEQAARRRKEDEKLLELKKQVIDYVNRKIEVEARKENGQILDREVEAMSDGEEKTNELSGLGNMPSKEIGNDNNKLH